MFVDPKFNYLSNRLKLHRYNNRRMVCFNENFN